MVSSWKKPIAACLVLSLLLFPSQIPCTSWVASTSTPHVETFAFDSQALAMCAAWARNTMFFKSRKAAEKLGPELHERTQNEIPPTPRSGRLFFLVAKDVVFLVGQIIILITGTWLDFHFLHSWTETHPVLEFVPVLLLSQLAALVGDSTVQWVELKKKNGDFAFSDLHPRRIGNLMGTGLYSAIIDNFVYVVALPAGLSLLHLPPLAAALTGAFIDLVWISPRLTEPLAYFVYAHYFEGATEKEAMAQIRENGLEVYVYAAPVWFVTTCFSLLSHDPISRFAWISVGILCWNVIFSLKAGEKSSLLLERWGQHRVLKWFVPFLRRVQMSLERPHRAIYLKRWLSALGTAFFLHEIIEAGIFGPSLVFAGLSVLVTNVRKKVF